MVKGEYILSDKARKDLCCRIPRLLKEGNLSSAERCLGKYSSITDSPILLSYRIAFAEASGDQNAVKRLYRDSVGVLNHAAETSPCEVRDFFCGLFAYYLGQSELDKAVSVFRKGKRFQLEKTDYGILWIRYCDMAKKTEEGLSALHTYLASRKKLSRKEIDFLRAQYPNLGKTRQFEEILMKEHLKPADSDHL